MVGKLGHQRALASRLLSRQLKLYILLGSFVVVALTCPGTRLPTSGDSRATSRNAGALSSSVLQRGREATSGGRPAPRCANYAGRNRSPRLVETYRLADLLTACSSSAASFLFIIISYSRCYPCVSTSSFLSGPERLSSESFGVKIYIVRPTRHCVP
jgi:hypothetical protein